MIILVLLIEFSIDSVMETEFIGEESNICSYTENKITKSLFVVSCLFSKCVGVLGGAISIGGVDKIKIKACCFNLNYAKSTGGAIFVYNSRIRLSKCTSFMNKASVKGREIESRDSYIEHNSTYVYDKKPIGIMLVSFRATTGVFKGNNISCINDKKTSGQFYTQLADGFKSIFCVFENINGCPIIKAYGIRKLRISSCAFVNATVSYDDLFSFVSINDSMIADSYFVGIDFQRLISGGRHDKLLFTNCIFDKDYFKNMEADFINCSIGTKSLTHMNAFSWCNGITILPNSATFTPSTVFSPSVTFTMNKGRSEVFSSTVLKSSLIAVLVERLT